MSLDVLRFAIGPAATELLCAAVGGADLRVPSHPKGDAFHRLSGIVGEDAARALIRHAGGDVLYVPRCTRDALAERDRRIVELAEQGMTPADIARSFVYAATVTERHVYRILAARKARH